MQRASPFPGVVRSLVPAACPPSRSRCQGLPHSSQSGGGGRVLVEDDATAAQLYSLARDAGSAADFAAKLRSAGLMAGGGGGPSGGASTDSSLDSSAGTDVALPAAKGKDPKQKAGGKVPQLSKELAHGYARDGIIIVTWANLHFLDFTLNWVHHMEVGAAPFSRAGPVRHVGAALLGRTALPQGELGCDHVKEAWTCRKSAGCS